MNKQKEGILMKLFNEQQKLNLELFKAELIYQPIDYKSEKMSLQLSIYESKGNLRLLKEIDNNLNKGGK